MAKGSGRLTVSEIESGKRTNTIQKARIRKTRWFFENRAQFMAQLYDDIIKATRWSNKHHLTPVFRLNGTSDIRWETIPVTTTRGVMASSYPNIMHAFPYAQFYDYTKLPNRKNIPTNYHLTFSLADGNDEQAEQALRNGMNVAAVFRNKAIIERYKNIGFVLTGLVTPVVDGDDTDLRFLDQRGAIVALYAKGNAKNDRSGFVRD
jgi:hypothetical protein